MLLPHKMRETDRIIFLHIPKTAGTSVYHYFCQLLGHERVGWLGVNFGFADLQGACDFDRFKVIGGHFTRDQAGNIPFEKTFISLVREPFSRAESYYSHLMSIPSEAEVLGLTGDINCDLNGQFGQHIANQQCAFLGLGTERGAASRLVDDGNTGLAEFSDADKLLGYIAEKLGLGHLPFPKENVRSSKEILNLSTKSKEYLGAILYEDRELLARVTLDHSKTTNQKLSRSPLRTASNALRSIFTFTRKVQSL
ncbi:sulfotransferase family 2 domain-containing protein [Mesorhizobium sp. WSM4884]|uniref:sulfotransferase family 2 domain-containing protein n=1 Tax=Mesorhizobium sp. WSM4884 TaxID=3038542 RepID=UPI0024173983|nr:sulfotransferase family 2 domain-containing protein [Mesorhizobium sp. WSM4884]MDG4880379.1 sulfotransferase family 2 domain-containing protein [Mesorhizobium sp. WSM4884]